MAETTAGMATAAAAGGVGGLVTHAPGSAAAAAAAAAVTATATETVTLTPVAVTPGVSVCGHLVTPLFGGAGNSILFLTQDLAQLMKSKFGATWPAVQIHCDSLQTREMRYVAGGLLASVVTLVLWKCYKRYKFARAKRPLRPDPRASDAVQWHNEGAGTPRAAGNEPRRQVRHAPRSTIPTRVVLHHPVARASSLTAAGTDICKARVDAAGGPHRHACRQDAAAAAALPPESQQPGSLASFLAWGIAEPDGRDDDHATNKEAKSAEKEKEEGGDGREEDRMRRRECACPQPTCGCPAPVTPSPASRTTSPRRLLYSVKESRVVRRAMDLNDPQLATLLSYAGCPTSLPSSVITPTSNHCPMSRAECQMTSAPIMSCSPHHGLATAACFPAGQRSSPHNADSRRVDSSDGGRRQPGRTGVESEEKEGRRSEKQEAGSPHYRQPYPSHGPYVTSCHCSAPAQRGDHPASPYQVHHTHVSCNTQPLLYQTPQGPVYVATHHHCTNSRNAVQGVPYNQNAACPIDQASQTEDSGQCLPVVHQPSDTTLSITGSELDRPQETSNKDGAGQREKAKTELVPRNPGEIVPNEGTLMQQNHAFASKYPPFHPGVAGFRPDFAQGDLPWFGMPNSDQVYLPKPCYSYNNYNPNEPYPYQPSWLSPPGGYFMPSAPMMYPSQGMFMPQTMYPSNFHPQFMYPQQCMPDGSCSTKQAPGGMGGGFCPDYPLNQGRFMVPRMPHPQPPQSRNTEPSRCRLKQTRSQTTEARGRARRHNLVAAAAEVAEGMEIRSTRCQSRDMLQDIPLSGVEGYQGIVSYPSPALSDVLRAEGAASAETVSGEADGAACSVEHSESYYMDRSSSGGQTQSEELRYMEMHNTDANGSMSMMVDGVVSNESLVDAPTAYHRMPPSDGMETQL